MGTLFFLLAVVFFILWLTKKPSKDERDDSYRHGYWDGYRAFGEKVQEALKDRQDLPKKLKELINAGYPKQSEQASIQDEAEPATIESHVVVYEQPEIREVITNSPAQREAASTRNLNIILYVASFLFVAAAAVFVTTSMSNFVRLAGLWLVVVLFYGGGLILHVTVQRLRAAALAFTGTGLAILPFAGLALSMLGDVSAEGAWLITSLLGLAAYIVATLVLRSQVVAYLSMALVISLALSSTAALGVSIVWDFAVLIALALVLNLVGFLKPRWLPDLFRQPVEMTGHSLVPLALTASLLVVEHASLTTYEVVFGLATAHYAVLWLQQRKGVFEVAVRILLHVTLLLVGWDMANETWSQFAAWWAVVAVLQTFYSLWRNAAGRELWIALQLSVLFFGILLWLPGSQAALGALCNLTAITLLAILAAIRLRQITWGFVAIATGAILPFVVGRWLAVPLWDWQLMAWVFLLAAGVLLYGLFGVKTWLAGHMRLETLLVTGFWAYGSLAFFAGFLQMESGTILSISLPLSIFAFVFSYLLRSLASHIFASSLLIVAGTASGYEYWTNHPWCVVIVSLVLVAIFMVAAAIHYKLQQLQRFEIAVIFAGISLMGLIFTLGSGQSVSITSMILLLIASMAALVMRSRLLSGLAVLKTSLAILYPFFIGIAWLLSFGKATEWLLFFYAATATILCLASYLERQPWIGIFSNIALVCAVGFVWRWLDLSYAWATIGTIIAASVILYGMYLWELLRKDSWRQWLHLISVWVIAGVGGFMQMYFAGVPFSSAGALIFAVTALTLVAHGYIRHNRTMMEVGVYVATFGLQQWTSLSWPEISIVFYAHWWAAVIALSAWLRRDEVNSGFTSRLIIAMAIISSVTGVQALAEGGGYQILFLVEHLTLLVIGGFTRTGWALWWGIVGSILSVIYFLRDYPYITLAFLGLVLIGIVVWRLMRTSRSSHLK